MPSVPSYPRAPRVVEATAFAGGRRSTRHAATMTAAIARAQVEGQGNPDVIRAAILDAREQIKLQRRLTVAGRDALVAAVHAGVTDLQQMAERVEAALEAERVNFLRDRARLAAEEECCREGVTDEAEISRRKEAAATRVG